MTGTSDPTIEINPPSHLEIVARALAETHRETRRAKRAVDVFVASSTRTLGLQRAHEALTGVAWGDRPPPKAAEWFLDNYYLIRRVARQVEEELPRGFARRLPELASGLSSGRLRIEVVARELVGESSLELDAASVRQFVDAYQEVSPLTIAELWALPTMLRASVLDHLLALVDELHTSHDPGAGIERATRALRLLDVMDWKAFFENTSGVESILSTDPSEIYPWMDFATSDVYRKVVEAVAWGSKRTEQEVADLAISLAQVGASDPRHGHVGYYLVGDGRDLLERRLDYQAVGIERVRRAILRRPTVSYLLPLALLTCLPLLAIASALSLAGAHPLVTVLASVVAAVPVSAVAVTVVQWVFARLLPPRTLPKLDLSKGLSPDTRTLVVVPTLLGRPEDVKAMTRRIELHYLANPDRELRFALLTDDLDAEVMPESAVLLESATAAIDALNTRYGKNGSGPFHLLHRDPRWNEAEQRYMGWERKRGKLDELNRLLRGDTKTSYTRRVGDPAGLLGIRFVITLDSDTQLPMGSARRLIGILAHPLNRALVDEETGRVVAGYTIVQPRIETSPASASESWFSRIFAGNVGFDIYTHAASELYQDLFGSGIYVGKGIYDVDAFMSSLEQRAPENALVSHDLFEGVHGRAALASDVVLFEDHPSSYATYIRRMHRWVRGDWQLLPWLFPYVPWAQGGRLRNKLSFIDRWKIFDNLRRSVMAPFVLLMLVVGFTCLPASAWWWTPMTIGVLLAPLLPALAGSARVRIEGLARSALTIAFLAGEAAVVVDAVARVTVRTVITRRHLLQWTSAANQAFLLHARSARAVFWSTMWPSAALALVASALVTAFDPARLPVAAPFLLLWIVAPEIARRVSRPIRARTESLRSDDRRTLRLVARKTWRFFDEFVGPNDQWLPIDNYQAKPNEQTAHRTSPTNIGLMLLATLSAYDFGYLGPTELSLRLRRAFDSIARLPHYQGHLLNWYETKNLQPLLPRYVSTVDSGNFAGCLSALAEGCKEVAAAPVIRREAWEGLDDSLTLLDEVLASAPSTSVASLRTVVLRMQQSARLAADAPDRAWATVRALSGEGSAELEAELLAFLSNGAQRQDVDFLQALRISADHLRQQLQMMRREVETLLPWLSLADEPAAAAITLSTDLRLDAIPEAVRGMRAKLGEWEATRRARSELSPELEASAKKLGEALDAAENRSKELTGELASLSALADREVRGMDFRLLFDRERGLFHIGYNATLDQVDGHYYDLLASEARLASYLAIVKGDVPESHWYALGRPMTPVAGAPALLSWGGTMFEYLMPGLLMRSRDGSLLARTSELAVAAQIARARPHEPWGVSESAYARMDPQHTYQYRSFGVPGLGFKRGLEEDRVVAPYASMLAVSIRPHAVVTNLKKFESMDVVGTYGLFEALDLAPERALEGTSSTVVRSYMAHHQGMILVALGNALTRKTMVDRFHASPLVGAGELLLDEHAPDVAPGEWPIIEGVEVSPSGSERRAPDAPPPWTPADEVHPQAFILGNGRLTSVVTASGAGGLFWRGLALTRYQPDSTHDEDGLWIHLRDEDSGRVWLATSEEGRTTYAMHKAELHQRGEGISVHVDVAVAPAQDVEVRRVTLRNEGNQARHLSLTSAGRPALVPAREVTTHPAFTSMFIESERIEELDAVLFARRPRSPSEERAVLIHRLVHEGDGIVAAGFETDRAVFVGRCSGSRAPASLARSRGPLRGSAGAVLDPIMSLMATVTLKPKRSVTLAFVTAVAPSRSAAIALAREYGSMHAVEWAFRDAERESPRRLLRTHVDPALLPTIQRLYSALLFSDPSERSSSAGAARPCKVHLWGRGISGDDPIVLVRVRDAEARLLGETLAAQRYLRSCGVRLDLVLVDELASGYESGGSGSLRAVLARNDAGDWIGRHGGIFILAADQLPAAELLELEASARVVLDTRDDSLGKHWSHSSQQPPRLPKFEPTLVERVAALRKTRPRLAFDNGIGGFSTQGGEYVLTVSPGLPTPAPWCNVLANPEFGCLVSESSLGVTWSLNSGENRLTPWRNDPISDPPSEVLYLRDEETAEVWSPTPLPAGFDGETVIRHGAGYTSYQKETRGLDQTLTVFVPPHVGLKVVRFRIKNTSPRHRRLTATYYAEWVIGSRREEQRPYILSEYDRSHACLLATSGWNAEFEGRVAFLASLHDIHGFTTDRTEFLGRRGDYARPEALERWGLSGCLSPGVDPCAALQVHLELAPGEEIETYFVLGQSASRDEALALVERFRDPVAVEAAWKELGEFWDDILGTIQVKTPEPAMDLLLNRWLLYQSLSSRVFGRTGFYQSSGAFGYRDQLQDVLALLFAAPAVARAQIVDAASRQFEEGDVLHWWHPPSGRGVRTRCSDDMLWLVYVAAEYVAATGDAAILDELVPFLKGDVLRPDEHDRYAQYETSGTIAPLFEHCRRALERGLTSGAHGLPLFGDGDWNDGMNRVGAEGRGESVWLGWFSCATMERFATMSEGRSDRASASHWREHAERIRKAIEAAAWDGAWYLRAFHDDGSLIGSKTSTECRIDSIAQSWAALSTRPGQEATARARQAVRSADTELVREAESLVLLFWPPYDSMAHDPGYVGAYPPGVRENGGQYTHAATWLGFSHAALGDGERAERIFRLLNPIIRTLTPADSSRYRVEPYVLAGDVYSAPPWVGRGGWTWYTGAAAWMWRLGVEAILGIRKENGGLMIDPCIPPTWDRFEAWVRLGLRHLHIVVTNPHRVPRGIARMTLDGAPLDSNRVLLDPNVEGRHEVRVELGMAVPPARGALRSLSRSSDRAG